MSIIAPIKCVQELSKNEGHCNRGQLISLLFWRGFYSHHFIHFVVNVWQIADFTDVLYWNDFTDLFLCSVSARELCLQTAPFSPQPVMMAMSNSGRFILKDRTNQGMLILQVFTDVDLAERLLLVVCCGSVLNLNIRSNFTCSRCL